MTATLVPRRPIKHDPENPLEEWLSGKRVVTHANGDLRRAATLQKLAWCVALLGHDEDAIAAVIAERDQEPGYHKFTRPAAQHMYLIIARRAIRNHETWAYHHAKRVAAGS